MLISDFVEDADVPKRCIICPGRAGSREHVFPAALGGRRVNKGIYCGPHNLQFGHLAGLISGQLKQINALLGVRPDHSEKAYHLTAVNPSDGQSYLVSALKVELATPRYVTDSTIGNRRISEVQFANEQQLQRWISDQRTDGFKVHVEKRGEGMGYFVKPYSVNIKIGGRDALRAIGYIALTFLAHYFPFVARQPGIDPFKNFVLGTGSEQLVWWDFSAPSDAAPTNQFRFGHRILIGLSCLRQQAYARVSLFSTLDFAARLGPVSVDSDRTIIVDIDPQANRPPGDIGEMWSPNALAPVDRPDSLLSSLQDAAETGESQRRFEQLHRRIAAWHIECVAKDLHPEIRATGDLGDIERIRKVTDLLRQRGQIIFNMMLNLSAHLKQQLEADVATARIAPMLDVLVAEDPGSATGISQAALCALELATIALAQQVCRDDADGKLGVDHLSLLLSGAPGQAIVMKSMLQPLMMALGIPFDAVSLRW